jgi:hypothetical protein
MANLDMFNSFIGMLQTVHVGILMLHRFEVLYEISR